MNQIYEYIINGKKFKPFLSEKAIKDAVGAMAKKLSEDYAGRRPVFLVILKGAAIFAADLIREYQGQCEIDFVKARSYGDKMQSSGRVAIEGGSLNIEGRDVVIIEDIIDSGFTMSKLRPFLEERNTASIEICTLLSKPDLREVDIDVKYIGIEIPPVFVVGYGLDYAEDGRHLPEIFALDDQGQNI